MLRWWPWCAAILLLLWQVNFQFTYGFLADEIQTDLQLSPSEATVVSSAFLFAYGLMQLPAGLLIDRFGVRWVLPVVGLGAAAGVLFFSRGESLEQLVVARGLAGALMAFIFPGTGKIARVRLPARRFGLAMALADMCLGIGALTASNMSRLSLAGSWRALMEFQSLVGACLAAVVMISLIPMPSPQELASHEESLPFLALLRRRRVLLGMGLYVWGAGLTFGFAGYWNLKLQAACNCTAPQVSALSTSLYAGLAAGMLAAGLLAGTPERRRIVLRVGTIAAFVLFSSVYWVSPWAGFAELMPLMMLLGAALGTSALSFAVAVPGIPTHQSGTVIAIVNAAGCLGGALLQEIPIWLGRTPDDLRAMYFVYFAISALGVWLAFRLPRSLEE
ncbi:MAG: MFS transporter [Myxococcota bacterium]